MQPKVIFSRNHSGGWCTQCGTYPATYMLKHQRWWWIPTFDLVCNVCVQPYLKKDLGALPTSESAESRANGRRLRLMESGAKAVDGLVGSRRADGVDAVVGDAKAAEPSPYSTSLRGEK